MTQSATISRAPAAAARRDGPQPPPQRIGAWELVELAAEGSLAHIYRARPADAGADRSCGYALKMLRPEWEGDPQAIRMLAREAEVGRSVSHPHVVAVLGAGLRHEPPFVVMPWLDGATLQAHLAAGRRIEVPAVLWIARQVAEALDALHRAGWMHGDVKPENVLLSPEMHLTLLDLAFARRHDEIGSAVDRCVIGTCHYMAPEWITSALRPDVRSDIYSLGVVLFEIFSGRLPFQGKDLAELATQHRQAMPPDLQSLVPHLPEAVVALVRRMLSKEPLRRPQSPRELIGELAQLEIATFGERVPASLAMHVRRDCVGEMAAGSLLDSTRQQ